MMVDQLVGGSGPILPKIVTVGEIGFELNIIYSLLNATSPTLQEIVEIAWAMVMKLVGPGSE